MKLLKTDRLVPLVTISLIALFSFMLHADFTGSYTRSRENEIGTLAYEKRIAQRRYAEEVMWESIDKDAKVYNCDYLRTTEGSGAIVRLDDGTDIEMDENTLLMVCRSKEGVNIDLDSGSIATRKKQGDRAMKISTRFASIAVREGVLDMDVTKKGLNLSVSEGSAEMTAAGKSEKVGQGFEASVSGDAIIKDKMFARQVLPDINSYYVTAEKERRVDFSWEADAGRTVNIQVAKDAAFAAMAGKATDGEKKASLELPAGTYYWRLSDETGKAGPVRVFTIVSDRPAVPLTPYQSEQFSFRGKSSFVHFAWEPAGAASSYTIEIATDTRFKDVAVSLKSDANSIATDSLKPGSYYWRVRNDYGFNTEAALYSGIRQFSIVRAGEMLSPEPLVPNDGGTIPDISIASGKALFNWKSDPDYTGYEFTIAGDVRFGSIAYQESTGNNFHKPKAALKKGTYFWRVRGVTETGTFSPPSRAMKIAVIGATPPVLVAPGSGAAIDPAESKNIVFRWSGPNGGQRYRFELSSDKDFKKILKGDTVDGLMHAVSIPGTGTFFWRVKLLDTAGPALVSEHRQISVADALEAPGGAYPANNETIAIKSRSGMVFKWNPVEGATHYQVSVKRLVDGKEKVLLTTRVGTNRYQFTKTELLDAGRFMWEVSAIRQKGKEAEVRSKPEQNYFTIRPGKQLSAPQLKSRILYVE